MYRSNDGGDSWRRLPDIGPSPWHQDNHCLAIRNGDRPAVYVTGPEGLAGSIDEGESWSIQALPPVRDENGEVFSTGSRVPGHAYCRGMIIKPDDPDVMFIGTGNTIPGEVGAIQRSRDGGTTWETVSLPVLANSVVYWLATSPSAFPGGGFGLGFGIVSDIGPRGALGSVGEFSWGGAYHTPAGHPRVRAGRLRQGAGVGLPSHRVRSPRDKVAAE